MASSKSSKYLLAGGGLVVVGFGVFMLTQLGASDSEAAPAPPKTQQVAAEDRIKSIRSAPLPELHDEPTIVNGVRKIDPRSDEMVAKLDDPLTKAVGLAAGACYHPAGLEARKSRNQRVKMTWVNSVRDGVVTVKNLKVVDKESNLDDAEMQKCMFDAVAKVTFTNPELPDGDWEDMEKFAPERGLKKYTKENMDYEGDPNGLPVGKAVMTAGQAAPVSDTATQAGAAAAERAGR